MNSQATIPMSQQPEQSQRTESLGDLARKSIPVESKVVRKPKQLGIYYQAVLARNIVLEIGNVGGNMLPILEEVANTTYSGKCGEEGYIKPGSIKILQVGAPLLKAATVSFQVSFECQLCNPVEGMLVNAEVKTVTKAGIRADVPDAEDSEDTPMVIFVSRDHHYTDASFNNAKVGDQIQVRVIGSRFKFNDKYIAVIGQLVDKPAVADKQTPRARTLKKKLVVKAN